MEENTNVAKPTNVKPGRDIRSWVIIVVIFIVLVVLTLLIVGNNKNKSSSSSTNTSQQAGSVNTKLKQQVNLSGYNLEVSSLSLVSNISEPQGNGSTGSENQYMVAQVQLSASGNTQANYSYAQFSAQTDKGIYQATLPSSPILGADSLIGSGTLQTNKFTKGAIVVPLPKDYKYYKLIFTPKNGVNQKAIVSS